MSARSKRTSAWPTWAKPQFGSSSVTKQLQPVTDASDLRIKIFADGADRESIARLCTNPLIKGFTTNPTLMRKAGVQDYETFAREILEIVSDRPISFEVFSDDFGEMEEQALQISSWAENVYVKVPVTNTSGAPAADVVRRLANRGVKVNVTALMTPAQVGEVVEWVAGGPPCYISVFAGRIADTGRDPVPLMTKSLDLVSAHPNAELIWASPRELLNIVQADAIGCHIITVTHDLLAKLPGLGKDLDEYSLDTVRMFHGDGRAAGYTLRTPQPSVSR
jgi:transaldolase